MRYVGLIIVYLGVLINTIILWKCYSKIDLKLRTNNKIFNILIIFVFSILLFCIDLYVPMKFKIFIIYPLLSTMFLILYKDKSINVFFKTFLVYAILNVCDFLVSIILILLPQYTPTKIWIMYILKGVYTSLVSLLILKIFNIKIVLQLLKKIIGIFEEKINYFLFGVLILSFLGFYIMSYYNAFNKTFNGYAFALILVSIFFLMVALLIREFFKNKTKDEEQKQLLKIMSDYELILDKTRENRHEMINNLLVLKGEKNKNSKKYNDLLNGIIEQYDNKKMSSYSGLYKLPSGLKGIVYYKMASIKDNDVNFRTIISDKMYEEFNNFETKIYYKVCKIMGILIDNAVEASINSKEKTLLIYIYEQCNGNIVISIENSYNTLLDIHDINKKGYSTKCKNRGLGLFIANRTIEEEKLLRLRQYVIDKTFISELKIIKECNLAEEEQENAK